jgi:hypothetical protein
MYTKTEFEGLSLIYSSEHGHIEIVKLLLNIVTDIDVNQSNRFSHRHQYGEDHYEEDGYDDHINDHYLRYGGRYDNTSLMRASERNHI